MHAIFAQTDTGLEWLEAFDDLDTAQKVVDAGDHDRPGVNFLFIIKVEHFRDASKPGQGG